MGWTYTHKEPRVTLRDFFQAEFEDSIEILDSATKNRVFYAACRTKRNPDEVWALVCLIDYKPRDWYNFGYKDMDENMRPCEVECPERILNLLTPTNDKYALEWRRRCWENVKATKAMPKLKHGDIIRFPYKLTFSGGYQEDTFRVVKLGRCTRFVADFGLCRIPRHCLQKCHVIGHTA